MRKILFSLVVLLPVMASADMEFQDNGGSWSVLSNGGVIDSGMGGMPDSPHSLQEYEQMKQNIFLKQQADAIAQSNTDAMNNLQSDLWMAQNQHH